MIRKLQEIGRLAAQEFRNIPDGRKDGPGLAFAAVMQFPEKLLLGIAYGIGTRIAYPVCRNPERGNQRIENLEFGIPAEVFNINNGTDIYTQLLCQGSLGHSLFFAGFSDDRT